MQLGEFVDGGGNAQPAITYASGPTGLMGAYKTTGGYTRFAHDHQGSRKEAVADAPGYDPYGRALALPPNDALDPPLAFQGHEWRKELGLYYARNRWYDPTRGAFVSVDPIEQSNLNNYGFALANPAGRGHALRWRSGHAN